MPSSTHSTRTTTIHHSLPKTAFPQAMFDLHVHVRPGVAAGNTHQNSICPTICMYSTALDMLPLNSVPSYYTWPARQTWRPGMLLTFLAKAWNAMPWTLHWNGCSFDSNWLHTLTTASIPGQFPDYWLQYAIPLYRAQTTSQPLSLPSSSVAANSRLLLGPIPTAVLAEMDRE